MSEPSVPAPAGGGRAPAGKGPARGASGQRRKKPRHLPRRTRVLVAVGVFGVVIVAAVAGGLLANPSSPTSLASQGPPAPAFSLPPVGSGGPPVSLAPYRGRPVVMNFFGSWCVPCRTELPLLAAAARAHPGVQFLGVDVEDTVPAARAMMGRYGVTYPAGFDPNDKVAGLYAVRGTPTTVFIDAKGRVAKQYAGALTASTLNTLLQGLPKA